MRRCFVEDIQKRIVAGERFTTTKVTKIKHRVAEFISDLFRRDLRMAGTAVSTAEKFRGNLWQPLRVRRLHLDVRLRVLKGVGV